MDENKKFVFNWWMFFIGLILITSTIFGITSLISKPVNTAVDRIVLEQSIQYDSAKKDQIAMLEATLIEIDSKLSIINDSEIRKNLEAQKMTINALLTAAKKR